MVDIVKPPTLPNVAAKSVFSSGIGFNQFGPTRQPFGLMLNFDSIKENMRNILFFRKGDYPDNSDFGVGLQDFQFEPNDEMLRIALNQEIRRQVGRYEPRVTIRKLNIYTPSWADDSIVISMDIVVNNVALTVSAGANGTFNLTESSKQ